MIRAAVKTLSEESACAQSFTAPPRLHSLGIDVHEPPYITGTSERLLEEGNVFSVEPGVYLNGRFGVRVEDIVILRQDHAEVLSELPRDIFRCG